MTDLAQLLAAIYMTALGLAVSAVRVETERQIAAWEAAAIDV